MARPPTPSAAPPHRAGRLRGMVAVATTALALTGGALVGPAARASASVPRTTAPVTATSVAAERGFVTSINAARRAEGRGALRASADLTRVARAWAQSMARSQRLEHNPRVWTQVSGWHYLGENVGVGGTTSSLHSAFMHSAPHRANIVSAHYARVGIGVAHGGGRTWVVEIFERPFSNAAPVTAKKPAAPGYGSRGPLVRAAQHRLRMRATGYFGRVTLTKVRTLQKGHHLRVTGRLDTPTRKVLHV